MAWYEEMLRGLEGRASRTPTSRPSPPSRSAGSPSARSCRSRRCCGGCATRGWARCPAAAPRSSTPRCARSSATASSTPTSGSRSTASPTGWGSRPTARCSTATSSRPSTRSTTCSACAAYPGVAFDWKTILETPIPSADTERWRERRRVEKAVRHAVAEDEAAETALIEAAEDLPGEPVGVIEARAAEIAPVAVSSPPAAPGAGDASRRKRRRRHGRRGSDVGRAFPPREERVRQSTLPVQRARRASRTG